MTFDTKNRHLHNAYREYVMRANADLRPIKSFREFRAEWMNGRIMLDLTPLHDLSEKDEVFVDRLLDLASRVTLGMQCQFKLGRDAEIANGRFYFQIACWRKDVITNVKGWGYGGKGNLSPYMTDSEIFQIMFGLYKGYWEHEARENFNIDDVRPFGPHISTEALISVARKVDVRSAKHVEDQR